MDIQTALEGIKLTEEQIALSKQYAQVRYKCAKAKIALEQILCADHLLSQFRMKKSNLGYDMALLMLIEEKGDEARQLFVEFYENEAMYKGLEKIIDSIGSKISYYQSLMRYEKDNTQ